MGITKDGIEGEQALFELLRSQGFQFFQPDAIGYKDGCYYVFETKHQAKFTPPPFEGHGLPKWQVEARLEFQSRTTIPCVLVVFDKEDGNVYWQRMDKLEQGEHIDTHGLKPRRIYNLKEFKMIAKGNLNNV
jgi:hypothetical protein